MSSKATRTKACPKCGSRSMYLNWDENEWTEHCLMCGYNIPVQKSETLSLKNTR